MVEYFVTDTQTPEAEAWNTYHERRELAVVQPLGSLALVNTQIIDSEQPVWGVPGRWAPLPEGESGLKVIAAAADGIHVDGELVDGEAIVRGKDDPNPGEVVFSDTLRGFVIAQNAGGYALRIWDAKSEGIENFGGIDAFHVRPGVGHHRRVVGEPRGHDDGLRAPQRRGRRPAKRSSPAASGSPTTAPTTTSRRSSRAAPCSSSSPTRPTATAPTASAGSSTSRRTPTARSRSTSTAP